MRSVQLFLLAVLLVTCGSRAQAQVYTGQNFPAPGDDCPLLADTVVFNVIISEMLGPPPWYFAQDVYDVRDTVRFLDPVSTAYAADYPNATLAVVDTLNNDFIGVTYLSASNGDLFTDGGIVTAPSGQMLPLVYDHPLRWLQLPLQAGVSGSDTATGELYGTGAQVGIPVDSVHLTHTVFRSDTVDAVGMLTLPGLIMENAIRRITTDSIVDSIFVKNNGIWAYDPTAIGQTSIEKSIEWYHADRPWIVAQASIKDQWIQFFRYIEGPPLSVKLQFSGLPSDISILDTIADFQVSAYSIASGNLITDFPDSIRVSAFPDTNYWPNWQLDPNTVVPVGGMADFHHLYFNYPGQYRLLAHSDTAVSDTSLLITVHAVAAYLDVGTENYSVNENELLPAISVSARNDSGEVDAFYYQGMVRVGKLSGDGELLGTFDRPLVNGVATFDDLRITHQGQYQLIFYSPLGQSYLRQDTLSLNVSPNPGNWTVSYTDTLEEYVARANEFIWFGNLDGYLSGTSRGRYSEIGQHFDFHGTARVTKMILYFANRFHVGEDNDTFQLKIYDSGLLASTLMTEPQVFSDSLPISLVGSQYFNADSMHFGDYWIRDPTVIEFDNPPTVHSSFIVSLVTDSDLSNDTIILWHSVPGDALQEYRTSRLVNNLDDPAHPDTSWIRDKFWRPSYDVDLMMEPVLEIDTLSVITGVHLIRPDGISLYPDPANNILTIETEQPQTCTLELYSLVGQLVLTADMKGLSSLTLDIHALMPGTYTVCLRERNGHVLWTGKFVKTE